MLKWLLFGIGIWAGLIVFASCILGLLAFVISFRNNKPDREKKRI